jgi:hypothetical protein
MEGKKMRDTFRSFLRPHSREIVARFFEMARSFKQDAQMQPVDIWDKYDQQFYKYIIENAPDYIKSDEDALRRLIQQALFWRYGNKDKGGVLHEPNVKELPDRLDRKFNLTKIKPFTINNIPMFPRQLIQKFDEKNWNWEHPNFGYSVGMWGPVKQERAPWIINSIMTGSEMPRAGHYYHPKGDGFAKGASQDQVQAISNRTLKSSKKVLSKQDDRTERSTETLHLDDDDQKFIESFKQGFREKYGNMLGGPLFVDGESDKYLKWALGLRYSDHYITKTGDGQFVVRPEYRSNDEPEGATYVPLHIPWKTLEVETEEGAGKARKMRSSRVEVSLPKVYMNLPALAEKFERVKKVQDFVKEPLISHKNTPEKQALGRQAAERWMKSGRYNPNQGTQEILRDRDFYDAMSRDHELWRNRGDRTEVPGAAVSPALAAKMPWRQGNMIVEPPNLDAPNQGYNSDDLSFEDIVKRDARAATMSAIKILAGTKYKAVPNFEEWAKRPENFEHAFSSAWALLATDKTGIDPQKYRSQEHRFRMARNAAESAIVDLKRLEGRGSDKDGDDDAPSSVDVATGSDAGQGVNTQRTSHREEPDAPAASVQTSIQGADNFAAKPTVNRGDEPQWTVSPEEPSMSLTKPSSIPITQWIKMSRDQKIAAMRKLGLVK